MKSTMASSLGTWMDVVFLAKVRIIGNKAPLSGRQYVMGEMSLRYFGEFGFKCSLIYVSKLEPK